MTGHRQLVFDLPVRRALGRGDYFVSPANRLALAQFDSWPAWPDGRLAVAGPQGSGKTHLAHVWAERSGARFLDAAALAEVDPTGLPEGCAIVVEDADRLGRSDRGARARREEGLFHLCNRLAATGGSLLLAGRLPPAQWRIALPDLASRVSAIAVARLEAPDDALLAAVLVKLFADRQLAVTPDLIHYLVSRMERSFAAAARVVADLDASALAGRRPLTHRLAAEVLGAQDR